MTLDKREYRISYNTLGSHCVFNDCMSQITHFHQCERCGIIWEHATPEPGQYTKQEYAERHSCPDCGVEEYFKMEIDEVDRPEVRVKYPWRGFIKPMETRERTIGEVLDEIFASRTTRRRY